MSRRHYERPEVVESSAAPETVGDVAPAFLGRETTADEFARTGDLEQAFAVHKKLTNGGRQVKMPAKRWAEEFAAWRGREIN